jgi:hypothetical protein
MVCSVSVRIAAPWNLLKLWRAGDRQSAESSYILTGWLPGILPVGVNCGGKGEEPDRRRATSPRLRSASSFAFNTIR